MKNELITLSVMTALVLTLSSGSALAGTRVDESVKADADAAVSVYNLSGSVTVTGWDEDRVQVTGTLGDGTKGLDVLGSGESISIEVELPRNARNVEETNLEISVPRGARVVVEGVNLDIILEELTGMADLENVNGRVRVGGTLREVDVECVNGTIDISGVTGRVDAEAVSGTINITDSGGEVEAGSVSGSVTVKGDRFSRIDLESVSGSLLFEGALSSDGSFDFESHSGTVTLLLPADVSARFDVSTFSGDIDNEFGPEAERVSRYTPGKELEFRAGRGEARVSAASFSGSVRLKKQ